MSSIAVVGSGRVGGVLAQGLHRAGHQVTMARRDPGAGPVVDGVEVLDLAAAIARAEVVVNATPGDTTVERFAPHAAALGGRVLIDVSNAARPGTAAALQRALPEARVVKTLNTMLFMVMAAPQVLSTPATVFLSGDEPAAKDLARDLLHDLGWATDQVLDLGGIETAETVEATYRLAMAVVGAKGVVPFGLTAAF
jgi:8-hydroxy-5-deazaflavin:NADPH oxidoreductase